jgi:hypothetical protein
MYVLNLMFSIHICLFSLPQFRIRSQKETCVEFQIESFGKVEGVEMVTQPMLTLRINNSSIAMSTPTQSKAPVLGVHVSWNLDARTVSVAGKLDDIDSKEVVIGLMIAGVHPVKQLLCEANVKISKRKFF